MTVTYPFLNPIEPSGIEASGRGSLLFVPAIANINAPTEDELKAPGVLNISCRLYAWNIKGEQGKVERSRYCSRSTNESLGKVKYQADDITYDYDPQKPDDTGEYAAYSVLLPGTNGYIVDRRGFYVEESFKAGQYVDVIPVTLGVRNREPITTTEGEMLRVTQAVAVRSDPAQDVKIVAGA